MTPSLLHEFFEAAARRFPERIAVDVAPSINRPDRRLVSYADLAKHARALAHHLRHLIAGPDAIVVVLLPRESEHLYAAQLAILMSGAAFTCIDPAFPDAQVCSIVDDAAPIAILTDDAGAMRIRRLRPDVCILSAAASADRGQQLASSALPAWVRPESLAYLVYTSGTTGQPKGVMIEHRSVVNLVAGDLETLRVTPEDRVAQSSSPAYDSSIEETWFALAAGATLVVMDDHAARLGPDLVAWLRDERITMFCPPPTLLRATNCLDPERELPALGRLHPGGEALPQDVASRWAPGRSVFNDYGPTETTITALRGTVIAGQPVTIGRPVPGVQAWVLDEHLDEVEPGTEGELCIGGVGLARGYRHAPELTAARFPFHPRLGRIYRTGDLASRDEAGNFYCHGRIDAQVKVRGYRIELEAVESRLAQCPGVREAACTVQGDDLARRLVAFVVPSNGVTPSFDTIRAALNQSLPAHMIPALFGVLDELPRGATGKMDRRRLPVLEPHGHEDSGASANMPRSPLEEKVAQAVAITLGIGDRVSTHDNFFSDLGGDSLSAALLISRLRSDRETAALTVRDLYEAPTVSGLARRVRPDSNPSPASDDERSNQELETCGAADSPRRRPFLATLVQILWLVLGLVITAPITFLLIFELLPYLMDRVGLTRLVLLSPVLFVGAQAAYALLTVLLTVFVKKLLIGTYRPLRAPVWGSFYVRNWMVQRCALLVPWRLIEATEFQSLALRALGARIGRRVHIHRGVNLTVGGWDLLQIGDDVTVGQDASLQLVTFEEGLVVAGSVTLEDGVTLGVRAGVGADTRLEAGASLTAWSHLPHGGRIPRGERWDGVPARPAGQSDTPADLDAGSRRMPPTLHGAVLALGRMALTVLTALPLQGVALLSLWMLNVRVARDLGGIAAGFTNPRFVAIDAALFLTVVPATLLLEVIAMRLLGRVSSGTISRWSLEYVRVRLKAETVESAGRWLCGTLLWPMWLRAAGLRIGRGSEVSTIIDTIPELVEIGDESFLADGIHLAGPEVSRGVVTLAPVHLGNRVFLGNHSVVACGQRLPDDVLIGVTTVVDDRQIRPGTAWFGHPPFELHNRERIEMDRRLTHDPGWLRYLNRIFWELLRFAIPLLPLATAAVYVWLIAWMALIVSKSVLLFGVIPLVELTALAVPACVTVGVKWLLLGRVRPGRHPLWSCWCSRWDFLYVVWDVCATPPLMAIEGTLLLNAYLRAMGARVGRRVLLAHGFVHVADPDMIRFEDQTVVAGLIQAHTFEDRVLKMDYVTVRSRATVGNGALLLYGADVGEGTYVMPGSVVMKRERLLPGRAYAGRPTNLASRAARIPVFER